MNDDEALPRTITEGGHAWLREGSMPHSREDRVAEGLALLALLFSIGIGVMIASLPISAPAAAPSIARPGWKAPASRPPSPQRLAATATRCIEGRTPRPCVRDW